MLADSAAQQVAAQPTKSRIEYQKYNYGCCNVEQVKNRIVKVQPLAKQPIKLKEGNKSATGCCTGQQLKNRIKNKNSTSCRIVNQV